MFIPDPNFSIPDPGSRVKKIPDPGFGSASHNVSILTQKIVSKFAEIRFGMFIPDPDLDLLPIPYPGSRSQKVPDPGPDPQHWIIIV